MWKNLISTHGGAVFGTLGVYHDLLLGCSMRVNFA